MRASRRQAATAAVAMFGLGLGLVVPAVSATAAPRSDDRLSSESKKIRKDITPERLRSHLKEFKTAADRYGSRAAGTRGYDAGARYVEYKLREAGYKPKRQYFDIQYEETLAEKLTINTGGSRDVPLHVMSYSPSTPEGGVTADLAAPTNPEGCDAAAYEGADVAGKIALISRGTCSFAAKSIAAKAAGASAALVYNNAEGDLNGTLGAPGDSYTPTAGITQSEGTALADAIKSGPVNATLDLRVLSEQRRTFNVIAETSGGDPDNVVMLGSHLDGVQNTQAINDNGTGSSAVLETAIQMKKFKKLRNKVRFAFWGAEELGLVGSTHYVNDLVENDPAQLDSIATYLNFDMLGSPNHIISAYDADESTYEAPEGVSVPAGSIETEQAFRKYFEATDQPVIDSEFSGRSDYQAFIENGVASGGLFSGADGTKTAEERGLFGGTTGVTYDPNYHSPGDNLANVSMKPFETHADAIGHLTITLARSTKSIDVPSGKAAKKERVNPQPPHGVKKR